MSKILYTWEQFDRDIERLRKTYKGYQGIIRNVYGVKRGGLVLAAKLSAVLGVDMITDKKLISKNTLVVDDYTQTGYTLDYVVKDKKHFATLVLFHNANKSKITPTSYVYLKGDEKIQFPWE